MKENKEAIIKEAEESVLFSGLSNCLIDFPYFIHIPMHFICKAAGHA